MPRLSITLTESQASALDRIAAETGATKQSMIGLAVSAWIRENDRRATVWYGWARVIDQDPDKSRDVERVAFESETDAIVHAKAVTRRLKAEGLSAYGLWEPSKE